MSKRPEVVEADASFSMIRFPDPVRGPWGIRANWVMINDRPECVGLQIWRGADQAHQSVMGYYPHSAKSVKPITATGIAELPIATVIDKLRIAAREHWRANAEQWREMLGEDDPRSKPWTVFEEPEAARVGAPRRYGADHFRRVAESYLDAWQRGENPTQAVAAEFGVSRSAAAKWISRCRAKEVGLLTPATSHGRGGAQAGPALKKLRRDALK